MFSRTLRAIPDRYMEFAWRAFSKMVDWMEKVSDEQYRT
jgi:hypothetical protein